ncbi:MAG: galactose oxidase-like domain-containing protein, partial [Planctomycetota bacterium]
QCFSRHGLDGLRSGSAAATYAQGVRGLDHRSIAVFRRRPAQRGYYMVFVVTAGGVPSPAGWIQIVN